MAALGFRQYFMIAMFVSYNSQYITVQGRCVISSYFHQISLITGYVLDALGAIYLNSLSFEILKKKQITLTMLTLLTILTLGPGTFNYFDLGVQNTLKSQKEAWIFKKNQYKTSQELRYCPVSQLIVR